VPLFVLIRDAMDSRYISGSTIISRFFDRQIQLKLSFLRFFRLACCIEARMLRDHVAVIISQRGSVELARSSERECTTRKLDG